MPKACIQSLFTQHTLTESQAIMLGVGSKEIEGKGQVSTSVGLRVFASGGRRDRHVYLHTRAWWDARSSSVMAPGLI